MIIYAKRSITLLQMEALISTNAYVLNEFKSDNSWIILSSEESQSPAYDIRIKSCSENIDALTILVKNEFDIIPYVNTYDPVLFSLYLMTVSEALDPFIDDHGSLSVPDWMKCNDALRDILIVMPAHSSNNSVIKILDKILIDREDDDIIKLLDEVDYEDMEDQIYGISDILCHLISKLQCPEIKSDYLKKYVLDIDFVAILKSFQNMDDDFMAPFIEDILGQNWDTASVNSVSNFRPSAVTRIVKKLTLLKGCPPRENTLGYNSSKYFTSGNLPYFDIKWHGNGLGIALRK